MKKQYEQMAESLSNANLACKRVQVLIEKGYNYSDYLFTDCESICTLYLNLKSTSSIYSLELLKVARPAIKNCLNDLTKKRRGFPRFGEAYAEYKLPAIKEFTKAYKSIDSLFEQRKKEAQERKFAKKWSVIRKKHLDRLENIPSPPPPELTKEEVYKIVYKEEGYEAAERAIASMHDDPIPVDRLKQAADRGRIQRELLIQGGYDVYTPEPNTNDELRDWNDEQPYWP